MTTFPTPYTVTREPYQAGATDPLGNPVDSWGAAVSVPVHGWAPPSADQLPFEQNRSQIERDLDLYVPPSTVSAPRDHWTIDGTVYEQQGHAEDFTHGPFGFNAGLRINLNRVEG